MKRLKKYRKRIWWLFVSLCIGIYPYISHLCEAYRGYGAVGGEAVVLFIPAAIYIVKKMADEEKEIKKESRSNRATNKINHLDSIKVQPKNQEASAIFFENV